ncbi:MAG: hypothetical protein EOS58_25415 [Mesorhizobium sp.]|uniref:hypothetical protein n=1 Tax=Mesorhizobium sp. TaxID=1871066 RepID=UPI000FE57EF4|nr:hypothetical protein [Mesorhizobium sp.]RWA59463.1 MAG: hypothetical protein EOQ27_26455 [Mesorhizobium sp.]RWD01418.1 MAG: hypothetical protein EOS58_25415 [Mesorhizobium sp.]TIW08559.1 MAG: hypothetical protein E5V66_26465 [Mesorhizobium sp.]TIW27522.1 MAG: hypothetical protein E5V63_09245 [Mesorhizobium sp.]TIW28824.1 MAG: hypothetical protein E5V63_03725 [Mesorhizobium sp.]
MDQTSAENIVCTSIRAVALLNQLVRELQATLPEDEFELQRRTIGKLMGSICVDLLDPAASQCPSIDIETSRGWQTAGRLFEPNWLTREEIDIATNDR